MEVDFSYNTSLLLVHVYKKFHMSCMFILCIALYGCMLVGSMLYCLYVLPTLNKAYLIDLIGEPLFDKRAVKLNVLVA
jgi:hypothetical protein